MPDDIEDPKIARYGGVLPGTEPDEINDPKLARMFRQSQQPGADFRGTSGSHPTSADRGLANAPSPSDGLAKPKARTGRGRSSVEAVRSDPRLTIPIKSGPGFVFVGRKGQNIAREETVRAVNVVGQRWAELHPDGPRIQIGAVGVVYGGQLIKGYDTKTGAPEFHKSHQKGLDLDIKPIRSDNREGETTVNSPTYSHELTRQLIQLFRNQSELKVEYIFFKDPQMPEVRQQDDHYNHFHVRFLDPSDRR